MLSLLNVWSQTYTAILTIILLILVISIVTIIYLLRSRNRKYVLKKAQSEAKQIKMDALAEAKSEIALLKLNYETDIKLKYESIDILEKELKIKKEDLYFELEEFEKKEKRLIEKQNEVNQLKINLQQEIDKVIKILEASSNFSVQQAKEELLFYVEKTYLKDLEETLLKKEEKLKYEALNRTREILINAMQKSSAEITAEKNSTFFELEDESWKGKIIGKEGRNIKTFQQYCGVDIVIDDTPNRITISSFNPIRREIAFLALTELVKSGRIQPATIEEQIIIQTQKLEHRFLEVGYEVAKELEVLDLPEEIMILLGKLKYRHSYGQNVLQHSIEVGKLSKYIAHQLDLDPIIALRSGLLHDIGKAVDFEREGSHVQLGAEVLRKHKIDEIIVNAVESHHHDVEKKSIYAEIVVIADTISAARIGARNNDSDQYFIRMKQLEELCLSENNVLKAYVLQSGRQIRVIVNPDKVEDFELKKLAYRLKTKISQNNKVPGEITITIIKEKRESIKV